jgi:hypothetical protein
MADLLEFEVEFAVGVGLQRGVVTTGYTRLRRWQQLISCCWRTCTIALQRPKKSCPPPAAP